MQRRDERLFVETRCNFSQAEIIFRGLKITRGQRQVKGNLEVEEEFTGIFDKQFSTKVKNTDFAEYRVDGL